MANNQFPRLDKQLEDGIIGRIMAVEGNSKKCERCHRLIPGTKAEPERCMWCRGKENGK